jgi:DNA mismatch repair protein MLH1
MVGRHAVHCSQVAFSCKKHGESSTSISIQASSSSVDRVRQIYGVSVANELIDFSTSDDRWGFKASGLATNANYSMKKTTILLFINHRCVESTNARKSLEQTYAPFLPKGGHPFVYLSLEIDPQRVDVNIHPTKREVNFLNEDEIVQAVCEHIRSKLAAVDTSRTFLTQTLLPSGAWSTPDSPHTTTSKAGTSSANNRKTPARPERNDSRLVRTDTNLRKITSMLPPVTGLGASPCGSRTTKGKGKETDAPEALEYETIDREMTTCRLGSVRELRAAVREDMHHDLTEIFAIHTFVGLVDECRRLAAIQAGVKLFLVDYGRACFEYFYQVGLTDFGNFGVIRFNPPLELRELLDIAAEQESQQTQFQDGEDDVDFAEVIEAITEQLIERREMLLEYFSFEVSPSGELLSIPLLVKGYNPPIVKLPQFLLRLGPKVDWRSEKACFDTFLRELASFYVPEQLPPTPGSEAGVEEGEKGGVDADNKARRNHVRRALEHVLFPAFKARLVATNTLMQGGILEVANLKGLYRVFERC